MRLIMEHDVEQRAVDLKMAVVVDEPHFTKFVHEMTDARAGGADHLCQVLLVDSVMECFGSAFLAKMRQQQENAGQALLAGVEKLVDQILF